MILRIFIIGLAILGVGAAAAILGGSAVWLMGSADRLDIDGRAIPHGEPFAAGDGDWTQYGADWSGRRYSAAAQINRENIDQLAVAWTNITGDLEEKPEAIQRSAFQGTPILVENALIFCTPFNEVIALDPGTGAQKWRYDPKINLDQRPANQFVCRGIAHRPADAGDTGACAARLFMGTNDARLIALDAKTGAPCDDFGNGGDIRVHPDMDLLWPGEFQITSPPVVIGDLVVTGSSISDNARLEAPRGTVRAYDAKTGALRWTFDPIPRDRADPAFASWGGDASSKIGHANVWAPMTVDTTRGLIFLPTSSPSPDFYGGLRPGDNRYSNAVVALDGATGDVRWHFQTVHHDVWDYDLPAQPGLYTVRIDGRARDVVVQPTKTGHIFVLDRDTGEPVLPVEERPVPQGGAPGEALSPTQPFPVVTPAIIPTTISPKDAFGLTWFDKKACTDKIRAADHGVLYTPPSTRGTILYPFTGGGANWGGGAFDPARNLLVINMSSLAHLITLIPEDDVEAAREVYHDAEIAPQTGAPYGMKRELLLSPLGLPCTAPPWGVLAGVDLASGEIVWRKTLGTTEDIADGPILEYGTPTLGGPIITAGDLVFIGGTADHYMRAFDVETGAQLWRGRLPTTGMATPMTYVWEGRQYVVIASGGYAGIETKMADSIMAFALPSE